MSNKIARIHINRHIVAINKKKALLGGVEPFVSIKVGRRTIRGVDVSFSKGKVVHSFDKPLSCGATVWIEADVDDVVVDGRNLSVILKEETSGANSNDSSI